MKASEIQRKYAAGKRDFRRINLSGQSIEGQDFSEADFSGADFSQTNIRSTNFTNAILTDTTFRKTKAGLQQSWVIGLVIISLFISVLSGLASGLAGIFPSGTLGPPFIQRHGSAFPGLITYLVLAIFFISTKRQGFTPALITIAGVVAGILAIALALTWVLDVTENLEGTGTVVRAVAGVLSVTAVLTGAGAGFGALAFTLAEISGGSKAMTLAQTLAVILTGATTVVLAKELPRDLFLAGVLAGATLWLSFYIAKRVLAEDPKFGVIRSIAIAFAATGGTSFRKAILTDADFTRATLKSTDFRGATLTRTCWRDATKLDYARLGETYLKNAQVRHLVVIHKLENKNFDHKDLRGVNLQEVNLAGASFIDTDLSQANLQGANLFETKLVQTNLDLANLSNADLTGAYIENWRITRNTRFDGVKCKYVYLKLPIEGARDPNRMPPPEKGDFGENDFFIFITSILDTLDLYHRKDINPDVAVTVLKGLTRDYPVQFELAGLEKGGEDLFRVRLKLFGQASYSQIQREYYARYEQTLSLYDPKRLMPDTDVLVAKITKFVEENPGTHKNIYNPGILITGGKVLISKEGGINISGGAYYEQSGNIGIGHMSGGEIKDGAKVAGVINEAEQQNLAQAAAEIQQLLEQLSQTYPTTTTAEQMVVAAKAIERIESDPTWKQCIVNAIKEGGLAAFEKAIDNPAGAFVVNAIKGWQEVRAK